MEQDHLRISTNILYSYGKHNPNNQSINSLVQLEHRGHVLPGLEQRARRRREVHLLKTILHTFMQILVAARSFLPALQQARVAALQSEGADLDDDVGSGLEDDAQHADRAGDLKF